MTPFVGREQEVALLLDRWRDATEGEGQVVLLSGEAGIGKSRILAALRERIGDEPHVACAINARRTTSTTPSIRSSARSGTRRVSSAASRPRTRLDKLEAMIARSGLERERDRALSRLAAVDPARGAISRARNGAERSEGADDRGVDRVVRRADARRARACAVGGRALDRPDVARCVQPARRATAGPARAAGGDVPARVRRALGRPRPCRRACRSTASGGVRRWR